MIKFKKLTIRNFLSVGQVPQLIDFDSNELTLILGENLDLGGDGAKNGTGKTTMLQALSYALFGVAINNIKRDNLINHINSKNMIVTIDFSVHDKEYRIERGRKPNLLRFYIDNKEQEESSSDSQGDNRETQAAIEKVLFMSSDMFKHIVGLNSYSEPFLALKTNDQRIIIEQLLGITLLSEKADSIKELNKKTKEKIQSEEYHIRAVEEANKRINEQIDSLKRRRHLWVLKKQEDLTKLIDEYTHLSKIDIEQELSAHRQLTEYNRNIELSRQFKSLQTRQQLWSKEKTDEVVLLSAELEKLQKIDIGSELVAHQNLVIYDTEQTKLKNLEKMISKLESEISREIKNQEKLKKEIKTLEEHTCYACGQEFHDEKHQSVLVSKQQSMKESVDTLVHLQSDLTEHNSQLFEPIEQPTTFYRSHADAIKHSSDLETITQHIESVKNQRDPYHDQLSELSDIDAGIQPVTHYDTEEQAFKHSSRIASLEEQIARKHEEQDPYLDQIAEMEQSGIQEISFDTINSMTRQLQHQEFLLDLLTNKKSFVRRRIIEQNLNYLNVRLTYYLEKMGLPHQVLFQNDLTVEITNLGKDLDFDNLSRGERNRLILGLSFAFRDVWESLYSPMNILFVDELIDNGLDTIGVENSIVLLKDMTRRRNKSVWLISHRDELISRVGSILKVVKEGGFTTYHSMENF